MFLQNNAVHRNPKKSSPISNSNVGIVVRNIVVIPVFVVASSNGSCRSKGDGYGTNHDSRP